MCQNILPVINLLYEMELRNFLLQGQSLYSEGSTTNRDGSPLVYYIPSLSCKEPINSNSGEEDFHTGNQDPLQKVLNTWKLTTTKRSTTPFLSLKIRFLLSSAPFSDEENHPFTRLQKLNGGSPINQRNHLPWQQAVHEL